MLLYEKNVKQSVDGYDLAFIPHNLSLKCGLFFSVQTKNYNANKSSVFFTLIYADQRWRESENYAADL